MLTFPEINARVTDSDRVDGAVLTVVTVNYATGMVTLELRTDSATAPRGKRPVDGVLTYRQDMSRLTPFATRTVHSVTIPGHGLFRAYDDDVESVRARYLNRQAMLRDVNEIAAPEDYADVSTSSLAIILASFTPGSSAL